MGKIQSKKEKIAVSLAVDPSLKEQYHVIKNDLVKLRKDLNRGYIMAKSMIEKKGLIKEFFKER